MSDTQLPTLGDQSFESIKQTNEHGAEYWSARNLQMLLGYSQWRRFEQAIERAITSCQQSGNRQDYHFAGVGKPITGGKGAVQVVQDYHLSRFACYLIAQNGDPAEAGGRDGGHVRRLAGDCGEVVAGDRGAGPSRIGKSFHRVNLNIHA